MKRCVVLILLCIVYTCPAQPQAAVPDTLQKALNALAAATDSGDDYERCRLMCDIAVINLGASLDSEAENYASMSEEIARDRNYRDILARALTVKANVCAYAETDSTYNRNDEGLRYALEAVENAEMAESDSLVMEACCSASQLYVNKNRWNRKLDKDIYSRAGFCLDRADSLSQKVNLFKRTRLLAYRMRYYRQGGLTDKAIEYCERVFEASPEDDYLMKAQICDQLTALYIEAGRFNEAADVHSACVHYNTLYSRKAEADKLQELQHKYESEMKDALLEKRTYQILLLVAALILAAALSGLLFYRAAMERKRRKESEQENLAKNELIEFMSNDLRNPLNSATGELERFVADAGNMNEEQITAEIRKLIEDKRSLSRNVANYVSDIVISRKKAISDIGLSARELEIVRLSAEGLSTSQIAEKLFLSVRTVSNHKANIYSKMGVNSNAEMCHAARKAGLI